MIVELPFGATVRSLARALTREVSGAPGEAAIHVVRTGAMLAPDAVAAESDLLCGDYIWLTPSPGVRPAPRQGSERGDELAVSLKGRRPRADSDDLVRLKTAPQAVPASASEYALRWGDGCTALPPGSSVVGSGPGCEVQISLPGLAAAAFEAKADGSALQLRELLEGSSLSVDGTVAGREWISAGDRSVVRAGAVELMVELRRREAPAREAVPPRGARARPRAVSLSPGGEIPFNRPPRRNTDWQPEAVALPGVPAPPPAARLPYAAALLPLVAGLAMYLFTHELALLAFMVVSPVMAIGTYVTDRRSGRRSYEAETERFEAQLAAASQRLYRAVMREVGERHRANPQLAEVARRVTTERERLWERRRWDKDFLAVSLGWGSAPSLTQAVFPTTYAATPDERIQQLADHYAEVDDVPYVVDLQSLAAIGLAGERTTAVAAARALVLQAALLHSPLDLGIAAALPRGAESGWDWLKWLPHVRTASDRLGGPALGTGSGAIDVVRRMADAQRAIVTEQTSRERGRAISRPALLLIVDEQVQIDRSLVADLMVNARTTGTSLIWIGHDSRGLPGDCRLTVDAAADRSARVVAVETGVERWPVKLDVADREVAATIARELAPLRDSAGASAAATIPSRVRLLEEIGLDAPSDEALAARWQRPATGLGAAIGEGAGTPFHIDLRADGPHGLIAGTTGAGKSELLRTIVASLAANHPPTRLTFLLIDYKGGAAFAPCAGLPHVLDVVSDLDAELGERALVSLTAEMKRRELLLSELRADNLIDLERRMPEQAPPNLVIMVDEFAKLRDEIPEFIDGVVDVAQRGRTLGIHMLLAAQSLRSAFTPAIRANTNLRIALRVTSDAESHDVIDAPDAARIPSGHRGQGRAFARIGHERLVEFQTAHVSGRYFDPAAAEATAGPFQFGAVLEPSARRRREEDVVSGGEETDLAALARAAQGAHRLLALPAPRPVWTPPLPRTLLRGEVQRYTSARAGRVAFGVVDEPERQQRRPLLADLDAGHLVIFGGTGAGKTTALMTIAAALASDAPPSRLQIYGIDAGSGALDLITPLPHVGSVVPYTDSERVQRLLSRIGREARRRSQRFAASGTSTLTEYLGSDRADADVPRIILLVDGLGEFMNAHDDARPGSLYERLEAVLTTGRAAGVHVVVTTDRRGTLRSTVAGHIASRIALRPTTPEDLVAHGVPSRLADRIELPAGRGFTTDAKLLQIALPAPAANLDNVRGFQRLGEHLATVWPDPRVPSVDALPDKLDLSTLRAAATSLSHVAIAVSADDMELRAVDLADRHLLVSGPYRSGRSNVLRVIALQSVQAEPALEFHLLAPRRSPLLGLDLWRAVARGSDGCADAAKALAARVEQLPDDPAPRILVFVDDAGELDDAPTWFALEQLVRLGRDRGVRIVAAAETGAARMLTNPWIRELRKDGQGVLLTPESLSDGDILGVALPRRQPVRMIPGRGFLAERGQATLVQVPLVESRASTDTDRAPAGDDSTARPPDPVLVRLRRRAGDRHP